MTAVDPKTRHRAAGGVSAGPDASHDAARSAETTRPNMVEMVRSFNWPSESFWRAFELSALCGQEMSPPVLELGCGTGSFSELAGLHVDEGIDLSNRSVGMARRRTAVYDAVRCMDIRDLGAQFHQQFSTVFANSVLEHVPDVEQVLAASCRVLVPGGRLITTVPLIEMNDHLCFRARWYAEWRRQTLEHHNLWSSERWSSTLQAAGFDSVEFVGYLDPASCRFWDTIDLIGALGLGRARLSVAYRRGLWPILSPSLRRCIECRLASFLDRKFRQADHSPPKPSAALLVATRSREEPVQPR